MQKGAACNFPECGRPRSAHGLCQAHLRQQQRGTPLRPIGTPKRRRSNGAATCSGPECEKPPAKKGLCAGHYAQSKRGIELKPLRRPLECTFDECDRKAIARGLCSGHHQQRERGVSLRPLWDRKARPRLNGDGYVLILDRDHPNARKGGYVFEHTKVMSEFLGRALWPDENVHHKNGDRADNRIENLELWSTYQPSGQRVTDKLAYAYEIISRYGDDPRLTT